jgi:hypothetical protein
MSFPPSARRLSALPPPSRRCAVSGQGVRERSSDDVLEVGSDPVVLAWGSVVRVSVEIDGDARVAIGIVDGVAPAVAEELVRSCAAPDGVVSVPGADRVGAPASEDLVVTGGADQLRVRVRRVDDLVVAAARVDDEEVRVEVIEHADGLVRVSVVVSLAISVPDDRRARVV